MDDVAGRGIEPRFGSERKMQQQNVDLGKPRRPRRKVEFGAFAERPDGTQALLTLSNLSYDGCEVVSAESLRVGERIKLNLPRLGQIFAEIRWSAEGRAGALFIVDDDKLDT